jgi:rfaE bifunctional protein kinase chain/domain
VAGLVVDPERPTAVKTRIVARGSLRFPQQVARIDRVDRRPPAPEIEAQVIDHIRHLAEEVDAVLVSDYRSGLITEGVVAAVREVRAEDRFICVDSQGRLEQFEGFDLVKCNHHEAQAYLKRISGRAKALKADHEFMSASARMRSQLKVGALLITRGADGLDLRSGAGYVHLPAANRSEVFDVTGAGDTVVAVATLALAAGLDWSTAGSLANYAAGLVVRKLGVAAPSPEELSWAIRNW